MAAKTYLFLPDKQMMKQGYLMKDENGNVVYEGKMVKQALFGPMQFQFINHLSGKTEDHKVGHTLTTESSTNGFTDLMSVKSRFKLDGRNVWDHLHEAGVRIDSNLSRGKIGMTYDVTLKGQPLATLVSTTPGGKSLITSAHCYNVTAEEKDLDMAFLVTFAIARTEQAFYS